MLHRSCTKIVYWPFALPPKLCATADQWIRAGGDYYGGSAGAVLACDTIDIAGGLDPNECGLDNLRSLGLLPGVAILPHFVEQQLDTARDWAIDHGTPVWGLPESIGLQHNDDTVTVFGSGRLIVIDVDGVERTARPGDRFGFPLTDQQSGPSHSG
jgi:cyanophycinase-like exopeptidase